MLKSQDSKLDFTHSHHPVPSDWVAPPQSSKKQSENWKETFRDRYVELIVTCHVGRAELVPPQRGDHAAVHCNCIIS